MPYRSIAIDGPSGAGKSTLAKLLAECLHYRYVDTGAIYRTVGLAVFRAGIDPSDEGQVAKLLSTLDMGLSYGEDGLQRMYLDGEDVTDQIQMCIRDRPLPIPAMGNRKNRNFLRIFTNGS